MKKLINELNYEGCKIILQNHEIDYLNEELKARKLDFKNIRNTIEKFKEVSDVKYFSSKHINEISRNICEEIGRKFSSKNKNNTVSASSCGNFEDEYILANSNEIVVTDGNDTSTGQKTSRVKHKKNKIDKSFRDDGDYNIFLKNIRISNINK